MFNNLGGISFSILSVMRAPRGGGGGGGGGGLAVQF